MVAPALPQPSRPAVAPPIITIDGVDGSGKSTFADRLVAGLGRASWPAVVFRVDDFRRPVDWGRPDRDEADTYYRDYYALDLLEDCLAAFQVRAPRVTIPRFDPRSERLDGEQEIALDGAAVAVVEGVFPLRVPSAARGLVIYLDVPPEEAQRRLIERDLARGRTRAVIEHRLAARYLPAQAEYHRTYEPARRADVVVDNRRPAAPAGGPDAAVATRRDLTRLPAALRAVVDRLLPPATSPFSP
jgi:uridine kinase